MPAAETQASGLRWDIAYPDDRQETLGLAEIVDKYASGALTDDAFLWREGMDDWAAPFGIPELAVALRARGLAPATTTAAAVSPGISFDDDEATRVQASPFDIATDAPVSSTSGVWREPAKEAPSSPEAAFDLRSPTPLPFAVEPEAAASPEPSPSPKPAAAVSFALGPKPATSAGASPKPAAATTKPAATTAKPAATATKPETATAKPAAARRSEARGGGDLFGDLAGAGSEDDESLGSEARNDAAPKMTGARNESSVLFSLDALVKAEQPAAKKPSAKRDEAAAILMGTDDSPSSLSNVGTGSFAASSFGSALTAPDFTAPVQAPPPEARRASDPVDAPSLTSQPKKKGMGLWIALGAIAVLVGGAFALGLPAKLTAKAPAPAPSPTPAAQEEPKAPEPAPPAVVVPEPSSASSTAPAPASSVNTGGGPATPPVAGEPAKPGEPPKPAPAAKPGEPSSAKPAEAKPAEPAATASDAPPFDKGAAVAALTAAAGNAQSCKSPDGPTGGGKVSITFMPSGRATNTQVSGDLAGTAVGGCVARIFRSAKVPPFSGEAVTVSKSFSVQ